jgi:hypothetical protein
MGRTLCLGLILCPFGANSHTRQIHRAMPYVNAQRPLAFNDADIRPMNERNVVDGPSPNGAQPLGNGAIETRRGTSPEICSFYY